MKTNYDIIELTGENEEQTQDCDSEKFFDITGKERIERIRF